jgi:electron transfer flavoprotein alpha subunit
MSILVFTELAEGKLKKSAWEAAAYAVALAAEKNTEAIALAIGKANDGELLTLGKAGISKVLYCADDRLQHVSSKAYSKIIVEAASQQAANTIVITHNSTGKTIGPRIAVRMAATLLPGISGMPESSGLWKKSLYSGKAWGNIQADSQKLVVSLNPNSFDFSLTEGNAEVIDFNIALSDTDFDYQVVEVVHESKDMTPLPEAELVVSAGRGLKGPENWGMVEDLAAALGATTACSRPVADIGWRPHHEHVGQTGITIKPNLYIAIGISGAIQHLAGVNQSKCIVVINKDPEAPFFKAADYGIVGDAFEVVPKLTAAIKRLKND